MLYVIAALLLLIFLAILSRQGTIRLLKAIGLTVVVAGTLVVVVPWAIDRWDQRQATNAHMASLEHQLMLQEFAEKDRKAEEVRCKGVIAANRGVTIDPMKPLIGDEARAVEDLFQCRQKFGSTSAQR